MSASTKFTVRAATREDGPFLAWVLLQAGRSQHPRGLFEHIIGPKYTEEQLLTILTDFILDESAEGKGSFTHWDGWFVAHAEDGTRAGGSCPYSCGSLTIVSTCRSPHGTASGLTGFAYKEKPMPNFSALLAAVLAAKHGWVGEDFVALKDRYAMHNTARHGIC
ncbi:uncharacterized protein ACA1_364440 [Acanthamoeba castellanii str. Neff]|uniref:Uncharacterized protein n=1 Tax=Acanthamoeba castellanii (strain ATCC 30010 / Neff) TaxID=1257118 RepID=L8GLK4_ACACF|nr:uncharacterized protein ACA1_364440 [Acanthamoeba castellanii str. Neff]ELR13917.1 hypothetical protein ACA1_364440 [Acanthamoeba castellanii str. Neff]